MSQVDDILYAPIISAISNVDFQTRRTCNYDWKPISAQAHAWCRSIHNDYYRNRDPEGWMISFAMVPWYRCLNGKKFVFEEVSS
jgi:hypothetical protein